MSEEPLVVSVDNVKGESATVAPANDAQTTATVEGLQADRAREVTNSPAYTYLDQLQRIGKLGEKDVEMFKLKYQRLHDVVIQTYASESALLGKAKELNSILNECKNVAEQKTSEHQATEQSLKRLRQELHVSSDELTQLEDQRDMKRHEQHELLRRKIEKEQVLEERREQMKASIAPRVAAIRKEIQQVQTDLDEQREVTEKEREAKANYERMISEARAEAEEAERVRACQKQAAALLSGEPERYRAQARVTEKAWQRLEDKAAKVLLEIQSEERRLEEVQADRKAMGGRAARPRLQARDASCRDRQARAARG